MAIKYSTTTLSESTTTTSATTDINYQDALWLIIQLLCPSTKLIYLNDDGTGKNNEITTYINIGFAFKFENWTRFPLTALFETGGLKLIKLQ